MASSFSPIVGRITGIVARVRQQGFVRAASILVGGTAAGHAITALSLPVITRLYSPQDMSALAVFTSLLGMFAAGICLRFDMALSIPEDDGDAVNLLSIATLSALGLSALLAVVMIAAPRSVYIWFGHPELVNMYWLLPAAVLLTGLYQMFQFWFVRRRAYGSIAQSRIFQSGSSAGTQMAMGVAGIAPLGLLIGAALNGGAGAITLGARFLRQEAGLLRQISWHRMRELFHANSRFAKYTAPEAVANSASVQLPVVLIAAWASGPEAGYLMLAMFVIQAPMSLLGTALSQVYMSEAPARFRAGTLADFTLNVIGGILRVGVGPLIFLALISPPTFSIVFGPEWARAGALVAWMTPWFAAQLVVSPVAMGLHVTGHQRAAFWLQFLGLIGRTGVVALAAFAAPGWISEAYAVSGFALYFVYLLLVLHCVGAPFGEVIVRVRQASTMLLLWTGLGLAGVGATWLLRHFWLH